MKVMVVQSGQHRTTVRVEHVLGVRRVQRVGDFDDMLVDPDVGGVPVRQPAAANQHVASLASISSRTRRLSAAERGGRVRWRRDPRWLVDFRAAVSGYVA